MDAKRIIEILDLIPLPPEGGYYRETYRCDESTSASALHPRYGGDRSHSTAIYFLVTPDSFSALHRVKSDEVFHFYAGDPVEILQLLPDGSHTLTVLGPDLESGQRPQLVVPRGVWQGCKLSEGGRWALLGTTVAPGFDFDDYEHGVRSDLIAKYPDCADLIRKYTQ